MARPGGQKERERDRDGMERERAREGEGHFDIGSHIAESDFNKFIFQGNKNI